MATQDDPEAREHWNNIAEEHYSWVVNQNPIVGRLYHHLAILSRERGAVPRFFYFIKSLVVQKSFLPTCESIFTLTNQIMRQEQADPFHAAVAYLILASQSPQILKRNGQNTIKEDHLQAFYAALKKFLADGGASEAATCLGSEDEWATEIAFEEHQLLVKLNAYTCSQSCEAKESTLASSASQSVSDETHQPAHMSEKAEAKPTEKAQAFTLRPRYVQAFRPHRLSGLLLTSLKPRARHPYLHVAFGDSPRL